MPQNLPQRLTLVCSLALAGCDDEHPEDGTCFPVPNTDVLRTARAGEKDQGTSLQGGLPEAEEQGTSLQGGLPESELQGTSLQGGLRDAEEQGTSLQGGLWELEMQGTSLQGGLWDLEMQGTSLQGRRPGEHDQGTSLQGGLPDAEMQGTSLQGGLPESEMQGSALQGDAGPEPGPKQGMETQGAYLGLGDLNGVPFELPGTRIAVTVRDGELVAGGAARMRPIVDGELVVRPEADRFFRVQVTKLDTLGGTDRYAVLVDGTPVCAPGNEGVFVAGGWDETGAHAIDGDELTYACMDGVIAKCVDWGYAPWRVGAEVHQSCTRLARADYCGDGHPWTLDGTTIDAYDGLGVQARVADPSFGFEAAWGPDGAICVNETRYVVEDDDGRTVRPGCFADLPTCASLEAAAELGAVLANDSAHTSIAACD